MQKCFSDEQSISILREAEAGISARNLCRKLAISVTRSTLRTDRFIYSWMLVTENCSNVMKKKFVY